MVRPIPPERQGAHGLFTHMRPLSPSPPERDLRKAVAPGVDPPTRHLVVLVALTTGMAFLLLALALRLGPFAVLGSAPSNTASPAEPADTSLAQLTPPLRGFISRGLDPSIGHFGIDVAVPVGTPVRAAAAGRVLLTDSTHEGGLTLVLTHAKGLVTVYKHNDRLLVQAGDAVTAGTVIALSGSTGRLTTGPHLHFEAWRDDRPLDIRRLVEETEAVR